MYAFAGVMLTIEQTLCDYDDIVISDYAANHMISRGLAGHVSMVGVGPALALLYGDETTTLPFSEQTEGRLGAKTHCVGAPCHPRVLGAVDDLRQAAPSRSGSKAACRARFARQGLQARSRAHETRRRSQRAQYDARHRHHGTRCAAPF